MNTSCTMCGGIAAARVRYSALRKVVLIPLAEQARPGPSRRACDFSF